MTPKGALQTPGDLHLLLRVDENLDDALARLNDADRTAVTLRFLRGLSMREVAEQMGTSEAAANKRVTRAVEKLRDMFRRKGLIVAPGLLTTALLRQAEIVLPAHFGGGGGATTIAAAALEASRAGAAGVSAAAQLAHAAMSGGTMKFALAAAAAFVLLIAVITTGALAYTRLADHSTRHLTVAPTTLPTSAAVRPATATAPQPPRIRVGVYVSFKTATVKGDGAKRNWQQQFRIVDELHDPHLDVVPLIEPDSDRDPEMAEKLAATFPGKTPISFARGDDLRSVDVIVAATVCWPTEEALAAIEQAVGDGRGLIVRQCLGGDDNGYARPVVRALRLLDQAQPDALLARRPGNADVVASHPLLGELSGQTNVTIPLRTYGGYGTLAAGATPLLLLRDTSSVVYNGDRSAVKRIPGYVACPLAVGQLGQGRVVSCSFTAGPVPVDLDKATGGQFMPRAIRWAAGQLVE